MKYPISMSVQVVQLSADTKPHAWVSVGESDPSPIRISIQFDIGDLDAPENLQDFARQALAAVVEEL